MVTKNATRRIPANSRLLISSWSWKSMIFTAYMALAIHLAMCLEDILQNNFQDVVAACQPHQWLLQCTFNPDTRSLNHPRVGNCRVECHSNDVALQTAFPHQLQDDFRNSLSRPVCRHRNTRSSTVSSPDTKTATLSSNDLPSARLGNNLPSQCRTKGTSGLKERDMAISSRFLTLARWIDERDTVGMFDVVAEAHCSSGAGGCRSTDGQIIALPSKGQLLGELILLRRSTAWAFSWVSRGFEVVVLGSSLDDEDVVEDSKSKTTSRSRVDDEAAASFFFISIRV
ncbi:hypothetical protein GWK47_010290 [Chionoecetes opilio]|uniref:Uncharacterized protein n=1 Tax=Chionoecetes opilio TaxID=41210 RepID=A0A8J4XX79_CHIOP|nr:hypothetical protein GWK47_010290 [Chionoecetes opilio]